MCVRTNTEIEELAKGPKLNFFEQNDCVFKLDSASHLEAKFDGFSFIFGHMLNLNFNLKIPIALCYFSWRASTDLVSVLNPLIFPSAFDTGRVL